MGPFYKFPVLLDPVWSGCHEVQFSAGTYIQHLKLHSLNWINSTDWNLFMCLMYMDKMISKFMLGRWWWMISGRIHYTRTNDVHLKPVPYIWVAELAMLLWCCLVKGWYILQSFYCYLLQCLNKETWMMKLLSSWVMSSLVSERGRIINNLKQSFIASERAMLTTPSDAGSFWNAKWEQ